MSSLFGRAPQMQGEGSLLNSIPKPHRTSRMWRHLRICIGRQQKIICLDWGGALTWIRDSALTACLLCRRTVGSIWEGARLCRRPYTIQLQSRAQVDAQLANAGQRLPHAIARFSWINKNYRITVKLSTRLVYKFSMWIIGSLTLTLRVLCCFVHFLFAFVSISLFLVSPTDLFSLLTQQAHGGIVCFLAIKTCKRQFCDRPAEVGASYLRTVASRSSLYFLFLLFAIFYFFIFYFFWSGIYLMFWLMMDGTAPTQFGFTLAFVSDVHKLCSSHRIAFRRHIIMQSKC